MEAITLNNGTDMPLVGLGTWDLRGNECIETVLKAIQLGYRLIDTAQMYDNEAEMGKGIARSGKIWVEDRIPAAAAIKRKLLRAARQPRGSTLNR